LLDRRLLGYTGPMLAGTNVHARGMGIDWLPNGLGQNFLTLLFTMRCFLFHEYGGWFRPKSGMKNCSLLNRIVPPARQSWRNFT